jgi:transposase
MEKIVGVDTSKAYLDIYFPNCAFLRLKNDENGFEVLAQEFQKQKCELLVMEASGGVERHAYYSLWELGVPCAIVNPRNVRDFAKAMGHLEKTDAIDAKIIADFAKVRGIIPMPPPSQKQQRLSALNARMRQIKYDIANQKRRLHTAFEDFAKEGISAVISLLNSEEKTITKEIIELINDDKTWNALDTSFRSIKGVSDRTIATIMAELPQIGTISHKAISKLVGLAPIADDSGLRNGKRAIKGGRANVRLILFLVSDLARRFDKNLNDFSQKLLNQGKPKMVVRIAVAHKLLIWLNAKARDTRKIIANSI